MNKRIILAIVLMLLPMMALAEVNSGNTATSSAEIRNIEWQIASIKKGMYWEELRIKNIIDNHNESKRLTAAHNARRLKEGLSVSPLESDEDYNKQRKIDAENLEKSRQNLKAWEQSLARALGNNIDPKTRISIHRKNTPCKIIGSDKPILIHVTESPESIVMEHAIIDGASGAIVKQPGELKWGDYIVVPKDYRVKIAIEDSLTIYLLDNSYFTLPCSTDEYLEHYRLNGDAYIRATPGARMEIITSTAKINVKGTRFFVQTTGDEKTVAMLEEGSLLLTSIATGEEKLLVPGEYGEVSSSTIITRPLSPSEKEIFLKYPRESEAGGRQYSSFVYLGALIIVGIIGFRVINRKK